MERFDDEALNVHELELKSDRFGMESYADIAEYEWISG